MGYYDNLTNKTWQGTDPTATNRYKRTTKTYDPNTDMTGQTDYDSAQKSAVDKLNEIIANGGYSDTDKQKMIAGAMAPIYQQSDQQRTATQEDDYARGLGNSTVLNNYYGKIDQNVMSQLANITGQVTKEGADMVPQAIQLTQSGAGQQLDFQKAKAQLMADTNMNEAQIEQAYAAINSAADKSDADRQVTLENIKNQYNLSDEQLKLMEDQAKQSADSDLTSNLLGSGASILGKIPRSALKGELLCLGTLFFAAYKPDIQNYDTTKQQQADEAQRQRDEAARKIQLALAQAASDREAKTLADTEALNAPPSDTQVQTGIDEGTGAGLYTTQHTPGGMNYEKAQADIALSKAQAEALARKEGLNLDQTFHAYDEDIPMNEKAADGSVVPRNKSAIDADVQKAYDRWYAAQALNAGPKEKPPITEKEALIFDKSGRAIYANGQLLGPTLDDAASKAAAGYNWSTLKADINSGKIKGADLDKVYQNMARTVLGAIKVTDPTRRDEYTQAIVNYLKDVANAPEPVTPPAPQPARPGVSLSGTNIPPANAGVLPAAAAHPNYIQTGTGEVKDIGLPAGVDSMYEQGVWKLAKAIQNAGKNLPSSDAQTVNDILADIEQPGTTKSNVLILMQKLNDLAKRNNISTK